jgi:hypothetical protein
MKETILERSIFLIIGILIGLALSSLFCGTNYVPHDSNLQSPAILKNITDRSIAGYSEKLDSFQSVNKSLTKQLIKSKAALSSYEDKNNALSEKIDELITVNEGLNDTDALLANCDSLKQTARQFIADTKIKDSCAATVVKQSDSLINAKDGIIDLQQAKFLSLSLSFDQSIAQQKFLGEENLRLGKVLKRQKIKSKLLSVGALALSGTVIYGLIGFSHK